MTVFMAEDGGGVIRLGLNCSIVVINDDSARGGVLGGWSVTLLESDISERIFIRVRLTGLFVSN